MTGIIPYGGCRRACQGSGGADTGRARPPTAAGRRARGQGGRYAERHRVFASIAPPSAPCKICDAPAALYDLVDFNKHCAVDHGVSLPPAGIPIYYHRCARCAFIFTIAFDDWQPADFIRHIYNADYETVDPDFKQRRPQVNAAVIAQMLGADNRELAVFDYGGGGGEFAGYLRAAGFANTQSYDPFYDDKTIAEAEPVNVVTCFEVFEHAHDPHRLVADITALLDVDGIVVFSTLLQPDDIAELKLSWWYAGPRNGHVSLFSAAALEALWRPFGFRVGHSGPNMHIAFRTVPAFAKHLLKAVPPAA